MIGLHSELTKKKHLVIKAAAAGMSLPNKRKRFKVQPGTKHSKKTAIIMATSTAAFHSLCLVDVSCCCGFGSDSSMLPSCTATTFPCKFLAVLKTDQFRKTIITKGITMRKTLRKATITEVKMLSKDVCSSQRNTSGL